MSMIHTNPAEIARALRANRFEKTDDGKFYLPKARVFLGGALKVKDYRDNSISQQDIDANLLLTQGLIHVLNTTLVPTGGYAQITQWYIAPFSGNHTPAADVTAATFTAAATEFTAYTNATRLTLEIAAAATTASSGNTGDEALMTCSTGGPYNIYGAYIVSVATKSATTGKALAGIRLDNPKLGMTGGDKLGFEYVLTAADGA